MGRIRLGLATQILVGLVLGIVVGVIFYGNPAVKTYLQPLGNMFINLIKMIVIPIVISTSIIGVAGLGDAKKLGTLGGKTIIYFEIITTVAIVLGLIFANVFQPGAGVDLNSLSQGDIGSYTESSQQSHSLIDLLMSIVPDNVFNALSRGNLLAIIFFSVLFGLG